jgi:hypothetical protein
MKMEQTMCFETSAYKIQTPGNYPDENIQHTEHGESLKSRIVKGSLNSNYEYLLFIASTFYVHRQLLHCVKSKYILHPIYTVKSITLKISLNSTNNRP